MYISLGAEYCVIYLIYPAALAGYTIQPNTGVIEILDITRLTNGTVTDTILYHSFDTKAK